jgi:hypothetical protein
MGARERRDRRERRRRARLQRRMDALGLAPAKPRFGVRRALIALVVLAAVGACGVAAGYGIAAMRSVGSPAELIDPAPVR